VVLVHALVALVLVLAVHSAQIASSSCATTHNSSSYDRSYNSSRRCLSPSCSRSARETHSWRR